MMTSYKYWDYLVCGFLAITVIAGGSSLPSRGQFMMLTFTSVALLLVGVWRLRLVNFDQLTVQSLMILAAGLGLMFLQLIPLPQGLWSIMGARDFVLDGLNAARSDPVWLPLSLSPDATRQDILAVVPGVATFIAMLSVSIGGHTLLAILYVGLALIGMLLSVFGGATEFASGVFSNPNFFAAQIYMAIPFVVALAMQSPQKTNLILAGIMLLLCFFIIGQSGSRMGLLIAAGATIATMTAYNSKQRLFASVCFIGIAAVAVVILIFGGAGLDRMTGLQTAMIARSQMFSTSLQALVSFLPAGSGFGSFVPIYQMFEAPQAITPRYINHAHNDWLELVLEGGVLMAAILFAFALWFAKVASIVVQSRSGFARAAMIAAVSVLVHSLVDYPLRTPALMAILASCCGMMLQARFAFAEIARQFEPTLATKRAVVQ